MSYLFVMVEMIIIIEEEIKMIEEIVTSAYQGKMNLRAMPEHKKIEARKEINRVANTNHFSMGLESSKDLYRTDCEVVYNRESKTLTFMLSIPILKPDAVMTL